MKQIPNHIVFTTIFYPELLHAYHENLSKFGHLEDTCVWVVGDRKTPPEVAALCAEVTEKGLRTTYLDCAWQENWGRRYPDLFARLPWNNETRRNIGYLHALEQGCERLISIDDDNWPTGDDFVGAHVATGSEWTGEVWQEPANFHNVCEHIQFEPSRAVFPRGFPFRLRGTSNRTEIVHPASGSPTPRVGVTAGLWLNEPDIDATTWLNGRVIGNSYTGPDAFLLAQSTWSPINTQNTSVVRDLIPAYLCIPMGWDVPGGKIQRYGDIWGGYFLQSVLPGTPWHVAFGRPLVDHRRNAHDYVDDLRHEFWGTILTDWLLATLRESFVPGSSSIGNRVRELGEFLQRDASTKMPAWCPPEMRAFLVHTGQNLDTWAAACEHATAGNPL
jgi:hypothetical protein